MFLAECWSAEAQDGIWYGYFILNGYSQIVIRAIKAWIHEAIKEHHFNRRKIALILDKAFDPEWTKTLGGITFETMQAVTIRVAEVCACEK